MASNKNITLNNIVTALYATPLSRSGLQILNEFDRSQRDTDLRQYLRNYLFRDDPDEIPMRDMVRSYLTFCCVLTICWTQLYIPNRLPPKIRGEMQKLFSNEQVRNYFEYLFSASLLEQLDKMLTGETRTPKKNRRISFFDLTEFLMLLRANWSNPTVLSFLNTIRDDDNVRDAQRFGPTSEFLQTLSRARYQEDYNPPAEQGRLLDKNEIAGFAYFGNYCVEYASWLSGIEDQALSNDIWCVEKYWFGLANNGLKNIMERAINNLYDSLSSSGAFSSEQEIFQEENNQVMIDTLAAVDYLFRDN